MNTFKLDEKVIYTDKSGNDWDAVVMELPTLKIDGDEMAVISMNSGWPIYVPLHRLRKPLNKVELAHKIITRWNSINKLRQSIDEEYAAIQQLMREDGQADHELDRVKDMRTTQRNVLRYESRSELGNWEGFYQARTRD